MTLKRWRDLADAQGRVCEEHAQMAAREHGISLLQVHKDICAAGYMPMRYARNARTLSPEQQHMLLSSHVLLVGLGGLGGHVLDMLARMGVGQITGVDGDVFEHSNANRQLLCTSETLGSSKAAAAARHVAQVNPALHFTPVECFLRGDDFVPLTAQAHVVVDALGGLDQRAALHAAASAAGKPVVSAGIAGLDGWLAVVQPGQTSPVQLLGRDNTGKIPSVEERLGNLAPTVTTAAALQCAEILKILTGQPVLAGILFFDLLDQTFTRVAL